MNLDSTSMESKMRDRVPHRLSPHFFSSDEGPETGEDSEDDLVRSYLPADRLYEGQHNHHHHERMFDSGHIPAINITLHSPNATRVLEAEICQLADIQENIQKMREGELGDRQRLEARLSSSCPALAVEAAVNKRRQGRHHHAQRHRRRSDRHRSPSMSTGESDEDISEGCLADVVDGRSHSRDRSASLRPAPLEAVNSQLAKSVSTPHIPNENGGSGQQSTEEQSTSSSKSSRRKPPEPTHVFIQKLIAEHGWTKQGSGTDSETEGDDVAIGGVPGATISHVHTSARFITDRVPHVSPQLTLAEFLQNPALVEDEQRKRRRNKKERGGSLFSLRKKKDKKEGVKGLAKAGSAVSLQSRPVSAPRVPQHSYSMSSLKRYPAQSAQFYLARSESSKSTEEREELDGDKENLLDGEIPPGMELPETFPVSLRNLDTDPFLRIQKEEPETWATSVPMGVAAALKPHEAKRQEHIYEFIMTEKHHCQLLKVIQKVFCEGMVQYLDMKPELVERLFPQMETLISIHFEFLRQLRERQDSMAVIPTIADILLGQFQAESAVRWQAAYGAFCSQHSDSVAIYKDLLKSDRRFHEFAQQCSLNPLLRKMGIPECILTVTTRITKYPLLIEPLIKTAKERPEEQQQLRTCLHLVKSILVNVNGQVAEKERGQRLIEIYNRMDARSYIQYEGRKFKKSDFLLDNRKLLFEGVGTLLTPTVNVGSGGGRGSRSPAPLLVNIMVLSDVLLFLQETNQKYVFVTPENKSGVVPVHTLIAREKNGSDNKALYLISTSEKEPEIYELSVVQPRDRQDWIAGIRRAVDMSSGGPGEDSQLETEAELARKQLEAKYMRLRQLTGELRGKDMEVGRMLEDKMRILTEILEEQGIQAPALPPLRYTLLVQEREKSLTKEELLQEVQEASRLASSLYTSGSILGRSASSVGEHQSLVYESPALPKRAETFGGFDATLAVSGSGKAKRRADSQPANCTAVEAGVTALPPLLSLDKSQQVSVVQMTHYLNNIMCKVSEHFTSLEGLKVELAECREKAALGWGRYKHNQQLEELRNLQEQLQEERRLWQETRQEQQIDLQHKKELMAKLQASLEQEKKDVEEQRNKLYRKLEALSAQGIDIGPNMTVIGPAAHAPEPQGFIMEVRKAVSPPGDLRKTTASSLSSSSSLSLSHGQLPLLSANNTASANAASAATKKVSDLVGKNQHLLSATNETKGEMVEVKQQIPSKLAKLSLAGGSKTKDKKSASGGSGSGFRPSISVPLQNLPVGNISSSSGSNHQQQQQLLPFKLSESERKSVSPKTGYVKLSSSSFAEERVGRALGREEGGGSVSHARTGSSPAAMSGRPLANNTLPKTPEHHQHHPRRTDSPDKQQQPPLVQRVNYADSGEEVFFF